jgi:site-specific DNA recombinase
VVWAILRNPAYAGQAVYGKTKAINESAGLNRVERLAGRATGRAIRVVDRPPEEWVHIPVPAIITTETFERAGQRLADNKRFASRNSKVPSLLQGLAACAGCGQATQPETAHPRTAQPETALRWQCAAAADVR